MQGINKSVKWIKDFYEVEEKDKEVSPNQAMLGMLEVMLQDIEHMKKQQMYQISEQEKIHHRTLEVDKLLSQMVDNQKDMKTKIEMLIERWG